MSDHMLDSINYTQPVILSHEDGYGVFDMWLSTLEDAIYNKHTVRIKYALHKVSVVDIRKAIQRSATVKEYFGKYCEVLYE